MPFGRQDWAIGMPNSNLYLRRTVIAIAFLVLMNVFAAPAIKVANAAWIVFVETPFIQTEDMPLDIRNRESVTLFYRVNYQILATVDLNWNGDISTCNTGQAEAAFIESVARRINFYRQMAGLPPATLDPIYNDKAQKAALLTALNGLNHKPSASARCYSADAAQAAANSHLYIGRYGPAARDHPSPVQLRGGNSGSADLAGPADTRQVVGRGLSQPRRCLTLLAAHTPCGSPDHDRRRRTGRSGQ